MRLDNGRKCIKGNIECKNNTSELSLASHTQAAALRHSKVSQVNNKSKWFHEHYKMVILHLASFCQTISRIMHNDIPMLRLIFQRHSWMCMQLFVVNNFRFANRLNVFKMLLLSGYQFNTIEYILNISMHAPNRSKMVLLCQIMHTFTLSLKV